jgi:hypothetical protein
MNSEKRYEIIKAKNGYIISVSWSAPTGYAGIQSLGSALQMEQYVCKDIEAVLELLKEILK